MNLTSAQLAAATGATITNAARFVNYINEQSKRAGLNTPARVSKFLGHISVESQRLSKVEEDLSYSATRMTEVWPSRFPNIASALPYQFNPRALANKTYGGRMGNTGPDDGWIYRGRGLKQLTGKDNYVRLARKLGVPIDVNPDLVLLPQYAVATAIQYWIDINGNSYADKGDDRGLTKAINGGLLGYEDRVARSQHAERKLATFDQSVIYA